MRVLGRFRNSQQAFAQGVKIPWLFAFLAVRHMEICGKIVDCISGHKQFDVASAISNFKKILFKNISPFGTVKNRIREHLDPLTVTLLKVTEQRTQTRCWVNLLRQYHIRKY